MVVEGVLLSIILHEFSLNSLGLDAWKASEVTAEKLDDGSTARQVCSNAFPRIIPVTTAWPAEQDTYNAWPRSPSLKPASGENPCPVKC